MAKLITPTISTQVHPNDPPYFSLQEMQEAVGGYIQFVYLKDGEILVIDDEGKMKGKDPNWQATILAHANQAISPNDLIVGDALYCDAGKIDPD